MPLPAALPFFAIGLGALYAAMSPPAASSRFAASSAISALTLSGSQSGARGRRSCGLRFGTSHAGSLGCRQRSVVPSARARVRNLTLRHAAGGAVAPSESAMRAKADISARLVVASIG